MKMIKNNKNGITLIEISVSIGIFMMMALIGVGFLRQYKPNMDISNSTRELKNTLNRARETTINEQKIYGVRLLETENRYELVMEENGVYSTVESYNPTNGVFISDISSFTDNIVMFNKAGAAKEYGTIVLENALGNTKTITINPSGYVKTE